PPPTDKERQMISCSRSLHRVLSATGAALALGLLLFSSTGAFAQSTVVNVEKEPAPSLVVLPPLPGPLAQGLVFIPYRLENLRIVPVGGAAARELSPRVG